jgi:ABC-2 type transport system ATP-binding protein
VVGLLGPNGAGKTTAMRCIFGLVDPDRGEVRWDGAPIDHATRLRFGYMPEERGLYPHMRVAAQLEYLARLSGLDRRSAAASVHRWLARLGLEQRAESRLDALSHGNQQRVQLAAALVHDPVALVLDEPFAGLDPIGVESLSAMIADLARDGTAVLFSSHQLDLVEDICQDVVVVDRGRVVMHGELERLRAASERSYLTVGFRGTGCWTPASEHARVLAAEPGRTRLELTDGAGLEALVELARSAGELTQFSLEPPALSDLFHRAVSR